MTDLEQAQKVERVHPGALFTAFLTISLCGVGGGSGIIWARRIAVETRRWVTDGEFADIVSLCQFMPGPNIIGIAVCVGAKMRGAIGAIAAICGFLVIPWTVGLALGLLSLQYANLIAVRNIRRDCHIGSRASYRDGRKALEAASSPTGGLALCCARLHSDHRRKTAALRGFIFCCAD
jgi:hypothetical protein